MRKQTYAVIHQFGHPSTIIDQGQQLLSNSKALAHSQTMENTRRKNFIKRPVAGTRSHSWIVNIRNEIISGNGYRKTRDGKGAEGRLQSSVGCSF
jgi:hypothetical protein